MTRDDAIKVAQEAWPKVNYQVGVGLGNAGSGNQLSGLNLQSLNAAMSPKVFVEMAVALGMLKLDEPKIACEKPCFRLECRMRGSCAYYCPNAPK